MLGACKDQHTLLVSEEKPTSNTFYFPPISGEWETTDPATLGWTQENIDLLYTNLQNNDTRAFIVHKDGKIVLEKYWGKTLLGNADFDASKN